MEAGQGVKEMEEGKVAEGQESAVITQEGNTVVMKEEKMTREEERSALKVKNVVKRIGDDIMTWGIISCIVLFLVIIFLFGVGLLFYWEGVKSPSKPSFSMEDFYIPALNRTSNETQNTTIFYDLKLKNRNLQNSIRYGTINLTIYYVQNLSFPIATVSIPGFHQGFYKKAHRKGAVEAVGVPWDTARMEVSNGTTMFQVDLDTTVKNSIVFWYGRRKIYRVGNSLRVDDKGSLPKKGVKLMKGSRSSAPARGRHREFVGGLVGFVLLSILF